MIIEVLKKFYFEKRNYCQVDNFRNMHDQIILYYYSIFEHKVINKW